MSTNDKPTGTWRCRACGSTWAGQQLYADPSRLGPAVWTCGNLLCGGTCDRLPEATSLVSAQTDQPATAAEFAQANRRALDIVANPYASPEQIEWALQFPGTDMAFWESANEKRGWPSCRSQEVGL